MFVTKLEPVTKAKFKVYIDEEFTFVLYKGELSKYRIKDQSEIAPELVEKIKKEVVLKRAKLRAMHLLNDMDRTESSLRRKLIQGGCTEEIAEQAIDYVKSFGYIDDKGFAMRFIEGRRNSKSRKELYAALLQKGVSAYIAEEAMTECFEGHDEYEAIRALLKKKRFNSETADEDEKRKIYGFLARKGFRYDDIRHVIQVYDLNA